MLFSSIVPPAPSHTWLLSHKSNNNTIHSISNSTTNHMNQSTDNIAPEQSPSWTRDKDACVVLFQQQQQQPDLTRKRPSDPHTSTSDPTVSLQPQTADSMDLSPPRKRACWEHHSNTTAITDSSNNPSLLTNANLPIPHQHPQQHSAQPSPVTPTKKPAEWWKRPPPKSTKAVPSADHCFVCRTSLSAPSTSATTTTAPSDTHGMPRNALHKYFIPKQQRSSPRTSDASSTMSASSPSSAHPLHHPNSHACHFCSHALCASCTLTCLSCQHTFCTICCRSTEHVVRGDWTISNSSMGEGYVCFDCVPQEQPTGKQDNYHQDSNDEDSRMSID